MDSDPNIWYQSPRSNMGVVWFAPDDPSLPPPWKGVIDGNTGHLYYWNLETNITQYEKPAYWVQSSCSPPSFYHSPVTASSDYTCPSQYPNFYPQYQRPAETVINGFKFPQQFPFPNPTNTPSSQPIYAQSTSVVEPIYPNFLSFQPEHDMNPSIPIFQSPPVPTFLPQTQFLNPFPSFGVGSSNAPTTTTAASTPSLDSTPSQPLFGSTPSQYLTSGSNSSPFGPPVSAAISGTTSSSSSQPPISDVPEQNEVLHSRPAVSAILDGLEKLGQPFSVAVAKEVSLASPGWNRDAKRQHDDDVVDLAVLAENLADVQLLQDLTDKDTVDENDEPALILVDALVDNNESEGTTSRQSSPQIGGAYWMSLKLVETPVSGVKAPLECYPLSVVKIDECSSLLDSVLIVEKNDKFPSHSPENCLESTHHKPSANVTFTTGFVNNYCKGVEVFASLFDNCHFLRLLSTLLLKKRERCNRLSTSVSYHLSQDVFDHNSAFNIVGYNPLLNFECELINSAYWNMSLPLAAWLEKIRRNANMGFIGNWEALKTTMFVDTLADAFWDIRLNMHFFIKCKEPDKQYFRDAFFSPKFSMSSVTTRLLALESSVSSMEKAMREASHATTVLKIDFNSLSNIDEPLFVLSYNEKPIVKAPQVFIQISKTKGLFHYSKVTCTLVHDYLRRITAWVTDSLLVTSTDRDSVNLLLKHVVTTNVENGRNAEFAITQFYALASFCRVIGIEPSLILEMEKQHEKRCSKTQMLDPMQGHLILLALEPVQLRAASPWASWIRLLALPGDKNGIFIVFTSQSHDSILLHENLYSPTNCTQMVSLRYFNCAALPIALWSAQNCKEIDQLQTHSIIIITIVLGAISESLNSQIDAICQARSTFCIDAVIDFLQINSEFSSSRDTYGSVVLMTTIAIQSVVHLIFHAWLLGTYDEKNTCKPPLATAIFSTVAFLLGGTTSLLSSFLGVKIATYANARTTLEARKGVRKAFMVAFQSGAVMGFILAAKGLLVLYITISLFQLYCGNDCESLFETITGYGLGGSAMALFGIVGGVDLVEKIERSIYADDPRNPAVITDNVGDNVGDIAGMGSDPFGLYAVSFCDMLCHFVILLVWDLIPWPISSFGIHHEFIAMLYPLLVSSMGILVCEITTLFATDFFEIKPVEDIEPSLKKQLIISAVLITIGIAIVSWVALPLSFTIHNIRVKKVVKNCLIVDFNCVFQENILTQGHMYLCIHYNFFYSNIVGYETKKLIPFQEVTSVRKVKPAGIFPNAIEIFTGYKKYFFASFLSRDGAYRINDGWAQYVDGAIVTTAQLESISETKNQENGVVVEKVESSNCLVKILDATDRNINPHLSKDSDLPCKVEDTDGYWKWFAGNLASGGAAGASSLLFVYSLYYTHIHLARDSKTAKKGGERQFNGLGDVYKKTLKSDGIAGLYHGFNISCVEAIIVIKAMQERRMVSLEVLGAHFLFSYMFKA